MKNLKLLFLSLFVIYHLSFITLIAQAAGYVLPYPSYMPGHKLYRVHQLWERIQEYWYFGNLAKFQYHLKMADKYLVETKTLFEYDQHFLATQSLKKSNRHFSQTSLFLEKAAKEEKDISQKKEILKNAAVKHTEVLNELLNRLPEEIIWREEKKESQRLAIKELLEGAKTIREKI